jgi:hypothetical protein
MTFIISEDEALRKKLQSITVSDQTSTTANTPRPVGVWFGQPDQEIRAQSYPYITIDMIDVERDLSREHRGKSTPDYMTVDVEDADTFEIDTPIPVYIDYQITSYARHPRHDRQILAQLMGVALPIRFGILEVVENSVSTGDTTTNTVTLRRLDVMSVSKRDVTEQAKRLFVNAITVRVSSEIPLQTFKKLYTVSQVNVVPPQTTLRGGFVGTESFTITAP